MRKKTQAELERAKTVKTVRTIVRLKHSLAADEEINAVLPDKLDKLEEAFARGDMKRVRAEIADVFGEED